MRKRAGAASEVGKRQQQGDRAQCHCLEVTTRERQSLGMKLTGECSFSQDASWRRLSGSRCRNSIPMRLPRRRLWVQRGKPHPSRWVRGPSAKERKNRIAQSGFICCVTFKDNPPRPMATWEAATSRGKLSWTQFLGEGGATASAGSKIKSRRRRLL